MDHTAEQLGGQEDGISPPLFRRLLPLLLLTLAIAAVFLAMTGGSTALAAFRRIRPFSAAAALLLAVVPWFTDAARSAAWCRFLGRPVPYARLLRIAAASELGAAVAPPFVGTVPVKTALLTREGFTSGEAFSLTMLASVEDWIFYLIALPCCLAAAGTAVLPGISLPLHAVGRAAAWASGCCAALLLAAWTLRRRREHPGRSAVGERLDRLARWLAAAWTDLSGVFLLVARRGAATFLLTLLLTAAQWGCRYSVAAVLIGGLGLPSHPPLFFALQILVCGLTTIVPTPGGTGGAEALFALLHRPHLPEGTLGVVTAAWRIMSFYVPLSLASLIVLAPLGAGRRHGGNPSPPSSPA
jgi:hypothetical protein